MVIYTPDLQFIGASESVEISVRWRCHHAQSQDLLPLRGDIAGLETFVSFRFFVRLH
jgi:hypothetical protein